MFMLLHWYCPRGLGCGKMIKFALKIFNIFGEVYTHDGTISLCQHNASSQTIMSHKYSTQVSDPFRSPPPWSPYDMIITDICQYIICPILWALVALNTAVRLKLSKPQSMVILRHLDLTLGDAGLGHKVTRWTVPSPGTDKCKANDVLPGQLKWIAVEN